MKLTFDQIKTITTGVMEFVEDGGLWPRRFTREQMAIYTDPTYQYIASESAGITLDLHTDATALILTVDGLKTNGNDNRPFDLLIDGVLERQIDIVALDDRPCEGVKLFRPQTMVFELPAGEKRVTVYFPWQCPIRIMSLELENAAFFRPHEYTYTMLAFGDSITHGASAKYPSMSYAMHTARRLNARLHNFAVGGEMLREDKIIPGTYPKCDFVTIAYGTNDFGYQTEENFSREMPIFFRKAAEAFPDVPIFVILPTWRRLEYRGGGKKLGTLPQVRQKISDEAAKYPNMTVFSARNWVPHTPDFFGDELLLHPNDLGMTHYTMHLTEALRKHL